MLFAEFRPEDAPLTIIIGRNGSGKSTLLRRVCERAVRNQQTVIAIAPSLFDRFRGLKRKCFKFFGGRSGRKAVGMLLTQILLDAEATDPRILRNFAQVLEYVGFERTIGLKIGRIDLAPLEESHTLGLSEVMRRRLLTVLEKWARHPDQMVKLGIEEYTFAEFDLLSFVIVLRCARLLYRIKAISPVQFFLFRKGTAIPLMEACSGELWFIISMGFIAVHIRPRSLIAIDEPETSLHPTWQRDCVRQLHDLFHLYEPNIVLATHSPIIVSGAEVTADHASVYEADAGELRPFHHGKLGLEAMYHRLFGIITPKNHYLSLFAVNLLNDLDAGRQQLPQVDSILADLAERSYDQSQIEAISAYQRLAHQLVAMKGAANA